MNGTVTGRGTGNTISRIIDTHPSLKGERR